MLFVLLQVGKGQPLFQQGLKRPNHLLEPGKTWKNRRHLDIDLRLFGDIVMDFCLVQ